MRKPNIENKYNLKIADIPKLKVLNRAALTRPPFWRNNSIHAYCISGNIIPNPKDYYGTYDLGYWIGIYDEDAPAYKGKIRCDFSSYGGMCGYKFKEFYKEKDIDNEWDLQLQERFLEIVNSLIDEGVLGLDGTE